MRRGLLATLAVVGIASVGGAGLAIATDGSSVEPRFAQKPLAGEPEVKLADVPGWVLHTAAVALPTATWTKAQLDKDEIGAVWEILGTKDGKGVEVDVFPDGSLEEIELIVDADQVPAAPAKLFGDNFKGFKTTKIEQSIRTTRTGLLETWWEWDGTTSGGTAVDVEVDNAGKVYLVEPD
jgi:hypothetical protein